MHVALLPACVVRLNFDSTYLFTSRVFESPADLAATRTPRTRTEEGTEGSIWRACGWCRRSTRTCRAWKLDLARRCDLQRLRVAQNNAYLTVWSSQDHRRQLDKAVG